jgi:hypothetical protein
MGVCSISRPKLASTNRCPATLGVVASRNGLNRAVEYVQALGECYLLNGKVITVGMCAAMVAMRSCKVYVERMNFGEHGRSSNEASIVATHRSTTLL